MRCLPLLHKWQYPDEFKAFRYCGRCGKLEQDVEAYAMWVMDFMLRSDLPASYLDTISEEHRAALSHFHPELEG